MRKRGVLLQNVIKKSQNLFLIFVQTAREMASDAVQRHSGDLDSFDVGDTKVQHYGLLMKKPFGHKSGRWQKR